MNLANRIKAAREYAELTQIELSKKVSLPQQTISKLERGIQQETAALIKIAAACGVNPFWLDSGEGEMVGRPHIEDERIKRGVMLLEQMQADDRLDDAMELLDSIAKFSRKSSGEKK
jgi:transcriptional regulator with XRE-family HTH domain